MMEAQPFLLMKSLPPSSGAVIGICVPSIAPNVWGKSKLILPPQSNFLCFFWPWHCYVVTHANGDSLDELPQMSAIDHPPTIPSPQFQTRGLVVASSTFVAACEFDILNERQLILPLLHVE